MVQRLRAPIATKIVGYGGTLVAAAALWGIGFGPLVDKSLDAAANHSNVSQATTGIGYMRDAAEWSPLFVLTVMFVGMISIAVFRSRRAP